MPIRVHVLKNRPENLRSAYCACAHIGMERGLCPLYTERMLVYWPAPAPHRWEEYHAIKNVCLVHTTK
ncbi:hypothetical protein NDU88_006489 [Pleurodeles waltl]|uniref:Uncharacterized protein n=1 Tax=Pleurodeles waltl TaxID=8319 RepID=A0AAV7QI62_PLEWA|nr:hypothetical protein NDU88_006489 [Pleurodeles waltl]